MNSPSLKLHAYPREQGNRPCTAVHLLAPPPYQCPFLLIAPGGKAL